MKRLAQTPRLPLNGRNKPRRSVTSPKSNAASALLKKLGIAPVVPGVFDGEWCGSGKLLESFSPNDGTLLAQVRTATSEEYERAATRAAAAFEKWQAVPPPG